MVEEHRPLPARARSGNPSLFSRVWGARKAWHGVSCMWVGRNVLVGEGRIVVNQSEIRPSDLNLKVQKGVMES
jgi:hypothetical protein